MQRNTCISAHREGVTRAVAPFGGILAGRLPTAATEEYRQYEMLESSLDAAFHSDSDSDCRALGGHQPTGLGTDKVERLVSVSEWKMTFTDIY